MKNKSFKCTDGFVTKTISAQTAKEAAAAYAIVACTVAVVEVDEDGNEIGDSVDVDVDIAP